MEQNRKIYDKSDQEYSESMTQSLKEAPGINEGLIYQFEWFPIITSPWIASISFILQVFLILHTIDFYTDMTKKVFHDHNGFALFSKFIPDNLSVIAFVVSSILIVISILTLFYNKSDEQTGYKYVLGLAGRKLFPFLRYIIDVNLIFVAIFFSKDQMIAPMFAIVAIVNVVIHFLCQNYNLRKDYLCCKSLSFMLFWKIAVILSYTINSVGYFIIKTSEAALIIFLVAQFVIFLVLYIFYFTFGFLIYRHTSSITLLSLLLSSLLSLSLGNLYDCLQTLITNTFHPNRNLIYSLCFFVAFSILSYALWTKMKKNGSGGDNQNVFKKVYFIFNKLENSSEDINDDCEIRGILRYHLTHFCVNQDCFVNQNKNQFYDSKKNSYCFPSKLNQGKTSFTKFLVKCTYQKELQAQKWANTQLLLDYTEFYFMKLKNVFQVTYLLVELEKRFLTPFQRIRLVRLKRIMQQQNKQLNQQLYNGKLDLENLIQSENTFDQILRQIKNVLMRNLQIWKYLQNDTVNLSTMVEMIKPILQMTEKINNNWKNIAQYFQIQKIWKFIFLCYTLYIRNEKIKPQLLQEFGQSIHQQQIFSLESLHIDKTTEQSRLFIPKMIFEQDACCMHIIHNKEKSVIKSVSRYFQRTFGYTTNQILESPLQVMMSPCFQQVHKIIFLNWVTQGKSSKENNYGVKKVFPVHKDGFLVCCFKFYKQYLNINKELQYVALFKKNKEQQNVIILNGNYQIQGMTRGTAQKLHLTQKDYQDMIGMNLLIFVPGLLENTKFQDLKNAAGDQIPSQIVYSGIKGSEHFQKMKRTQITAIRQLTKTNLIFSFPHFVDNARDVYSEQKGETEMQTYKAIIHSLNILKQTEARQKFKIEVQIKYVELEQHHTYFECYIRQIQGLNRDTNKSTGKSITQKQNITHYQDTINEQQLNNFFENSQNSQAISLAAKNNIFIKQQSNQPVKMMSHIKVVTVFVRVIFLMFFALIISSFVMEQINYSEYRDNTKMMSQQVNMLLKCTILINRYHSVILGIPGSKVDIGNITKQILDIRQNSKYFKKAMFNKQITPNKIYNLQTGDGKPLTYTQFDLLQKINLIFLQLYYVQGGNPSVNFTVFLDMEYTLVSFENLTYSWIQNIGDRYNAINQIVKVKNIICIVIIVTLFCVGLFVIIWRLFRITKSFISLMQIFTQFNVIDLKRIIKYQIFLQQLFNHLQKRYNQLKEINRSNGQKSRDYNLKFDSYHQPSQASEPKVPNNDKLSSDLEQQKMDTNLNKRVKKVQNGKLLTHLKYKAIIFIFLFLAIYAGINVGFNAYIDVINDGIVEFKNTGAQLFKYYSSIITYMLAYKDRNIYGPAFDINKYNKYIDRIKEMKKLIRIPKGELNGFFVDIRNNVLFQNVCVLYPHVLQEIGRTTSQCETVASRNLKYGIQSFVFFESYNVDYYLNNTDPTRSSTVDYDLEVGGEITSYYLNFLREVWEFQLLKVIRMVRINSIIIMVCIFIFQIIVYIILIQVCIVNNLKNNFLFFRIVYNSIVPDFIVTKEKIIKAKLEVEGMLNR